MRQLLAYIAIIAVLLPVAAAQQNVRTYKVTDVPNVHVSDKNRYVSDPDGILSAAARDTIDAIFGRLEKETGIEAAAVMLASIGEDDIFEFSHKLFRHWGIGKKERDNGLLIVFVKDQRKVRFTTGYGIEGVLPDIECKRIQTRLMVPAFRNGDWDAGMTAGAKAVYSKLAHTMKPGKKTDSGSNTLNYIFLTVAIVAMFILPGYLNRRGKKCRYCGKHALKKMSSDTYRAPNGHRMRKNVYVCGNCGRVTVKHTDMGGDDHGALMNSIFLASMLGGGRRHGGGFGGGGSFGGGDTGGGGADSGW